MLIRYIIIAIRYIIARYSNYIILRSKKHCTCKLSRNNLVHTMTSSPPRFTHAALLEKKANSLVGECVRKYASAGISGRV